MIMRALPYKAQTSIAGSFGGMFRPNVFHAERPGGVDAVSSWAGAPRRLTGIRTTLNRQEHPLG